MRANKKSFQEERHIRFKELTMRETIGFIGAGNMGGAMIEGIAKTLIRFGCVIITRKIWIVYMKSMVLILL